METFIPIDAPAEYVADFVRYVESLSPRHVGIVDTSLAHFYFRKGVDPLEGATLYVHHRPKVAQ